MSNPVPPITPPLAEVSARCKWCSRFMTLYAYSPDDVDNLDGVLARLAERHSHTCPKRPGDGS